MYWVVPAVVALAFTTVKEIFRKRIISGMEPVQFLFAFNLFAFLFSNLTLSRVSVPSSSGFLLVAVAGVAYTFSNLLGLRVFKEIDISVFRPMLGLTPVLVLFMSVFFLKEHISLFGIAGVALVLLPFLFLMASEYGKNGFSRKMLAYALLGIAFEAATVMLDRIVLKTLTPFTYFYFLKLFMLMVLLPYMLFFWRKKAPGWLLGKSWPAIALISALTMVGALFYFYALSDPSANTGVVKTILTSSIVFTTLIGGLYFREKRILFKAGLAGISLLGILMLTLK